jgi:hypothetical protein
MMVLMELVDPLVQDVDCLYQSDVTLDRHECSSQDLYNVYVDQLNTKYSLYHNSC